MYYIVSFTTNSFPEKYIPTEFDNYHTKFIVDGKEIELDLVDTSGKEEDKLRHLSFSKTDIFMLLFAINQRDSFINCKVKWLQEIQQYTNSENEPIPFILIGTKCDIKSKITSVNRADIDQFVKETETCYEYQETSALTQEGVKEAFECAVRAVIYPRNRDAGCGCQIL